MNSPGNQIMAIKGPRWFCNDLQLVLFPPPIIVSIF